MNERIRELAEQSGYGARWTTTEQFEQFMDKFAEVIVQECIRCLQPLSRNHSMVGAAQDTIREHFNLE